jgi:DNA replication protein
MHNEGFPEPMTYTPIPDSILGKSLVEFRDGDLLRCFLRILWHLHRSKGEIKLVELTTLESDSVIRAILANRATQDLSRLSTALKEIREFGLFMFVTIGEDNKNPKVLLNTHQNKRRIEKSTWQLTNLIEPTQALSNTFVESNIFELYEQNIGLITPIAADELKDMENEYPIAWIEEAIGLSVIYNHKSIRYISKILERWRNEGRDGGSGGNSQTVRAKDYIERYGPSGNRDSGR